MRSEKHLELQKSDRFFAGIGGGEIGEMAEIGPKTAKTPILRGSDGLVGSFFVI